MKRSRTCQCLQELDAPKRSRSTPDLGVLQRKNEVFGARVARNNYYEPATLGVDSALRLLLRTRPADVHQRATATLAAGNNGGAFSSSVGNGSFVFGSIVRSKGSLNEMTILEHEQFIGEESNNGMVAVPREVSSGGSSLIYGGAGLGHLTDDSGDSSDYFCGVDSNSDEADDEDGACRPVVVSLGGVGHNRMENGYVTPRASAKSDAAEVVVQQQHQQHQQSNGHCAPEISSSEVKPRGYGGVFVSPGGWTTVGGTPGRGLECKPASLLVASTASRSGASSGDETKRATVSPPWPGGAAPDAIDWRSEAATPSLHVTIEGTTAAAAASFAAPRVAPPDGMVAFSAPCRPSSDLYGKSVAALEGSRRHRSCHSLPIACVGEEVTVTLSLERLQLVDNATLPTKVPARIAEMGPDPLWKCRDSAKGPMEHRRHGVAYL